MAGTATLISAAIDQDCNCAKAKTDQVQKKVYGQVLASRIPHQCCTLQDQAVQTACCCWIHHIYCCKMHTSTHGSIGCSSTDYCILAVE